MSMSTHVMGFKPPNAKWKQMKAVFNACKEAGLEVPQEVYKFFEYKDPDESGVEVEEAELKKLGAIVDWGDDRGGKEGFELHISWLPQDIKIVRFYNSY